MLKGQVLKNICACYVLHPCIRILLFYEDASQMSINKIPMIDILPIVTACVFNKKGRISSVFNELRNTYDLKLYYYFKNEDFSTIDLILCNKTIDVMQSIFLLTSEDKKHSVLELNLNAFKKSQFCNYSRNLPEQYNFKKGNF